MNSFPGFHPERTSQNFDYVVHFAINVFEHVNEGHKHDVVDVPNSYLSFYQENNTSAHFPNDFQNISNNPSFTNEAINKYEHVYTIEMVQSLTESNYEMVEAELTDIVCTGQTSQLSYDFVRVHTIC